MRLARVAMGLFGRQPTYPTKVAALANGDERVLLFIEKMALRGPIDYAEIGSYEGETARRVAAALPRGSTIHLFDFKDKVEMAASKIEKTGAEVEVRRHPNTRKTYDSYNWSLLKLIERGAKFDLVFLDGAHSFHHDALAFYLIDQCLKPGGVILFDDYTWSHATSSTLNPRAFPKIRDQYTDEQINTRQVQKVVDVLVKNNQNYEELIPGFAYRKKEQCSG